MDLFDTVLSSLYRYLGIPLYLTTIIFSRRSWRKNVCVVYFLVSLLADFINVNNTLLGNIIIHGFDIQLQNTSAILCKLFNYLTLLCETLSSTLLVLASIDRLLISSENVETRLYSSRRLAYFSLGISIFFWAMFFLHVVIKFDIYHFGPFVSVRIFEPTGFYESFFSLSLLSISLILFLTMVILTMWSFRNVRRIRLIPRQQRPTIRTMHKKDFQLLRCLVGKDIVYFIGHAPLVVYTTYAAVLKPEDRTYVEQARSDFLFNLAFFTRQIFYCFTFFVYTFISRAFRHDLKRLLGNIFGKNSVIEEHDRPMGNAVNEEPSS